MAVKDIKDLEKEKFDENGAVKISGSITVETNPVSTYATAAIDEVSSTLTYIGKEKSDGTWLLQRITESGTITTIDYANIGNNGAQTTYTLAWTNRLTLTYTLLENLINV